MSKLREAKYEFAADLPPHADGTLLHFVIFTRRKAGVPFRFAGYVNAPDGPLALLYARDHYGQDEVCDAIWAIDREEFHVTPYVDGPLAPADASESDGKPWTVFTQRRRGDIHVEAGTVTAVDAPAAVAAATARFADGRIVNLAVAATSATHATAEGDVIWRSHDQSYRLARGYAKDVKEKWIAIRNRNDYEQYAEDDLEKTF